MNSISVIEPVSTAIERVKTMLFRPFDMEKWLTIGFCAWLSEMVSGGFTSFNFRGGQREKIPPVVMDFVHEHLRLLITLGAIVTVIVIAVIITLLWLSSRGRFMFLHCVAKNRSEVVEPWRLYRAQANSLFLFRLIVGFTGIFAIGVVGAIIGGAAYFLTGGHMTGFYLGLIPILLLALFVVMLGIPVAILFAVVMKFTKDFVVPIMYLRGVSVIPAWRELLGLIRGRAGSFALYVLFQIVLALAIGAMVLIFIVGLCCCTCCIGGLLMMLPYVSTVVLLPVLVFTRSYSLYYLRQFGGPYDVFLQ